MTLLDDGWTTEQAKGLLDSLKLDGGIPEWETNYLEKLRDWCARHDEDWTTIEAQLEFVAYELCHSYEGIGAALKSATTIGEAKEAIEPYVQLIRAPLVSRGPRLPR
jgi:hypothetical protein